MSIPEFFKSLKLDTWYKALVYLGGLTLILSLFIEVKGIENYQLQRLSVGVFLFGLGEWKNWKIRPWIKPPNAYTGGALLFQIPVWKPDIVGLILDLSGLVFLFFGIKSFF